MLFNVLEINCIHQVTSDLFIRHSPLRAAIDAPAADGPLGITPLSWAAHCKAGKNSSQDPTGDASGGRCVETVRALIAAGADVNAARVKSRRGTPLSVAVEHGQHEIADMLRKSAGSLGGANGLTAC